MWSSTAKHEEDRNGFVVSNTVTCAGEGATAFCHVIEDVETMVIAKNVNWRLNQNKSDIAVLKK